ncbi:MAG: hypothetical protein JNL59_01930 [Chitinophagaceae bacterium]|nr:hypothetical protein [Chitinophagaceae bacterium]
MKQLAQGKEDTCTYTGIFGCLLTATVLIQHILITRQHWLTFVLLVIYLFSLLSFIMLATKSQYSPVLIAVNTGLLMFANVMVLLQGLFSAALIALMLYSTAIVCFLYVSGYPALLNEIARAKREEEKEWEGKI